MENEFQLKSNFLFEKYLEYYKGVELHHLMNIDEFLNDEYVYRQIYIIFYNDKDYKKWFNKKHRKEKLKNIFKII